MVEGIECLKKCIRVDTWIKTNILERHNTEAKGLCGYVTNVAQNSVHLDISS